MNDSPAVITRPVQTRADMETFIRLPRTLQGRDPCWVAPFLDQQRHFLSSRTGPFFEHGEAQFFLACRAGQPVGRLSAHVNRAYDERHDARTGFFGFSSAPMIPPPPARSSMLVPPGCAPAENPACRAR